MSKILKKTVNKVTLLSIILATVLVAATIIGIFFGFNNAPTLSDSKMLTVTVDTYLYETEKGKVQEECENALKSAGISYVVEGDMDGINQELVYVFDADADLEAAKKALNDRIDALTGKDGAWEGFTLSVMENEVAVEGFVAKDYALRGAIAVAVIAVLACAYVAFRYKWRMGVVAGVSVLLSVLLTTAIIVLTRIVVTPAVAYVIAISALLSVLAVLFNLNNLRSNGKEEGASTTSAEDLIVSSVAVKETLILLACLALAVLLVGVLGGTAFAWFAVSAFVSLVVTAFIAFIYAPALTLPLYKATLKAAANAKSGYKGAKKGEKKESAEAAVKED